MEQNFGRSSKCKGNCPARPQELIVSSLERGVIGGTRFIVLVVAIVPNLWFELVNEVLLQVFADVGMLLFDMSALFVLLLVNVLSLLEG